MMALQVSVVRSCSTLSQHPPLVVVCPSGSPGLRGIYLPSSDSIQMGHEAGQSTSEAGLSIPKPSMLFSLQSEMSETRQGRSSSTGDEEENLAILRR